MTKKKLLILGSNVGSVDIVEYAKELGAYTIVADYYPSEKSIAKQYADESVLISTADTEALKSLIVEKKIDCVLAGVSEFNLRQAEILSSYFHLPFYFNKEQWEIVENKGLFRKICQDVGVPTPQTYYIGSPNNVDYKRLKYPLIVKPTDSSSSRGVVICRTENDIEKAILEAANNSLTNTIIIEEFFEGEEFTATYTIVNHQSFLSAIDNRLSVTLENGATSIPILRLYPSTFINEYIKKVDDKLKDLISKLGIDVGTMFVQCFYNKVSNEFAVFEAGLRCAGEAPYRFLNIVNGVNYMKNIVEWTLCGKVLHYDSLKEDPYLNGKKCAVLSFVSGGGKIEKIKGFKEVISKCDSIVDAECRYNEGAVIGQGNTLRQIVMRFVLVCKDIEELQSSIQYINKNVFVLDDSGKDICVRYCNKISSTL